MWPWGHAAVGYLGYTFWILLRERRIPPKRQVVAVLLGTQLPDLIDKPLAWTFSVLPEGRSLGHSLLTALVLTWLVAFLLVRIGRGELVLPFNFGYLVGIGTDIPPSVLRGDLSEATFLLWPLLASPSSELEPSLLAHIQAFEWTPSLVGQTILFACAAIVMFLAYLHQHLVAENH